MRKFIFPLLLSILLLVPACGGEGGSNPASPAVGNITYLITQNYGAETVLEEAVSYQPDRSVMEGLFATKAEVETAYGGDFVSVINGLSTQNSGLTGERYDWFYYVNGIFADVGALDYLLLPGDQIWWDYHPWKVSQGTPAVVGCWPEPFLHGFRGKVKETVVLPVPSMAEQGKKLQAALQELGVQSTAVRELDGTSAEELGARKGPIIAVGAWPELARYKWLAEFNEAWRRNGTFLHFSADGLELLDHSGQVVRTVQGSAGVIMATAEGNGDDSPLWIVTGSDAQGTAAALDILIEQPEKIKAAYSIVILPDEVMKLPAMRE
ncbi:MAG: DUF4430 domain-containing protein [Clostridia bacterium]|jgi:hypothetical protein|nr:DUF4430 domain-containing protein [Clostridia bacterium]